ncbi:hypothetical protein T440DRAFT_491835 [Plenodomus tracheiphilus IPT5]|uniref:Aminoglycoside phosphotransferase domain-containing protein n=1 Tax=Plenodomus tracheiphilus IPT5 TaxID=1408161 RepID=A0A6A7AX21_9PLEO|nr:hypothetical protein T440DRAFT_491835 [Plenodomus tracheiphilus IPT5]
MSKLQLVTEDCAGVVTNEHTVSLQKFKGAHRRADMEHTSCDRWTDYEHQNSSQGFVMPEWAKLRYITLRLHELGFIPDSDKFYFCHQDLFARNILIKVFDESNVRISGVIDWDADYAAFCPKFVAFQAPYDLCVDDEEGDWDETRAMTDDLSSDPHNSALRDYFLQSAGDEWRRFATSPEYMIARRIFDIFRQGAFSNQAYKEMNSIVAAWQDGHYGKSLSRDYMSDSDSESEHSDSDSSNNGENENGDEEE